MGWVTHAFGWPAVFYLMGAIGIVASLVWLKVVDNPARHPKANAAELAYIERGGGLVRMDQHEHTRSGTFIDTSPKWSTMRQLVTNRMLPGVYIGQYGINTLTWFFLTWFPIYLVKERGFSILSYLVSGTGSFGAALVFVAANALLTVFCYLVVVGDIHRVALAHNGR